MDEFIAVNDTLESCKKIIIIKKAEISGLSPNYF